MFKEHKEKRHKSHESILKYLATALPKDFDVIV